MAKESFQIHEDAETSEIDESTQARPVQRPQADYGDAQEEEMDEVAGDDNEEDGDVESSDDNEPVDNMVQHDMEKLQETFPSFKSHYRLIKRIGEGTFSTVYKAEDLRYNYYNNKWDLDARENRWTPPPRTSSQSQSNAPPQDRRKPKFVAVKKIYVTSSPSRIFNELELLHDLRDSPAVCPLITAMREGDQVLAVLPYFRHQDFRKYYPNMTVFDMRLYFRSLFTALAAVHKQAIIHRDIKPTNFLYDPDKRRGVLVDFGLAEREGVDSKPCLCHEDSAVRKQRVRNSTSAQVGPQPGYPKNDTRPSRRANRAGTRGFRAPEVLFKCTEQTTKIDIWSAGVILLTILCRRFPFFNSADDVEAMIEIATIFGTKRMKQSGALHGCVFDTNIPSIGAQGFSFEKIMLWSTCRSDGKAQKGDALSEEEKEALEFLSRCMDLDPNKRISADEALEHPFLKIDDEDTEGQGPGEMEEEDVMLV
ncbi:kinase-like domain-containing protein [Microdochium trichocladiopsis]|uniref:non-specific serine/threonine protein kinase n=1 Tax=Microdochium trichocladiopsis TaxID=1682393 RepID=A0A9P8XUH8_9PEZI|nr:kinase-like domain-containing protein [Microdochium trichocladiopsis]KAH7018146.1 kinase-like domain-containing protein [Microdochium trichocladiopsis]